jgi:ubiquinone/menaquinone biosynthesis C-methylase UbiE
MRNVNYLFDYSASEVERLKRQAQMLKPITRRLLITAGIEKGMRVLDIGCGPGDVTMLVADLVGSTGRVVGIDRDESVIDAARRRISERNFSNVEFAQCDVETYDGPASFDAAVCRYVLVHQTDPVRLLKATRALVRAGGIIAVHEIDSTRGVQSSPRVPLLHQMEALLLAAFREVGTAADAGGRLVQLFADAGMGAPDLFAETIVESGEDGVLLPWLSDTLRELLPRLVASGVVAEEDVEIDTLTERLQRAAVELRSQLEFVPQICGWARV